MVGVAVPFPRCCTDHCDWSTLARHLVADFTDLPVRVIVDELRRAKDAGELFRMELHDALDCAELIVRQRVSSATGIGPGDPRPNLVFTMAALRGRPRTTEDCRF